MTDFNRTHDLVRAYYAAFNRGDRQAMLDLLTDDIAHDLNQGMRETGKPAFAVFMQRMDAHYRETLTDIVITVSAEGWRAGAEYVVHGEYLSTDEGLPAAHGQRYVLPGGAFFDVVDVEGEPRIARVTNYYNLQDWIAQVVGQ